MIKNKKHGSVVLFAVCLMAMTVGCKKSAIPESPEVSQTPTVTETPAATKSPTEKSKKPTSEHPTSEHPHN